MKVKCPVIQDLLPLYIDGVCSEESRVMVEDHIKDCKACEAKLRAQKEDLLVDEKVIADNLKLKEPFKRIKRFQRTRLIVILLAIPFLLLSFIEIRGDGVGFSALYGRYKTQKFLSYVEKGEFEKASKYTSFDGGRYGDIENKTEAKNQWIEAMEQLEKHGTKIVSHRQNRITTDDRFTSGFVTITVAHEEKTYDFLLFIATNSGKVEPGHLSRDLRVGSKEPSEVEKKLMENISEALSTYNPG